MSLEKVSKKYQLAIEEELKIAVYSLGGLEYNELTKMMAYHMGWEDISAKSSASGKRIRPLITILTNAAAGGNWETALPAAVSIELIHNFSLLHDDIEDNSLLRRGRPTVWSKWGIAQAINTGDAMLSLANHWIFRLADKTTLSTTLTAATKIQNTCIKLTQGQFLDISFEDRNDVTTKDYWTMITGKTAALISCASELGAVIAEVDKDCMEQYRLFGQNLGLAFQVLDDILGIWGDSEKIGKSNLSDLSTGKKSLPVLFGLEQNGEFASMWKPEGTAQMIST